MQSWRERIDSDAPAEKHVHLVGILPAVVAQVIDDRVRGLGKNATQPLAQAEHLPPHCRSPIGSNVRPLKPATGTHIRRSE